MDFHNSLLRLYREKTEFGQYWDIDDDGIVTLQNPDKFGVRKFIVANGATPLYKSGDAQLTHHFLTTVGEQLIEPVEDNREFRRVVCIKGVKYVWVTFDHRNVFKSFLGIPEGVPQSVIDFIKHECNFGLQLFPLETGTDRLPMTCMGVVGIDVTDFWEEIFKLSEEPRHCFSSKPIFTSDQERIDFLMEHL